MMQRPFVALFNSVVPLTLTQKRLGDTGSILLLESLPASPARGLTGSDVAA